MGKVIRLFLNTGDKKMNNDKVKKNLLELSKMIVFFTNDSKQRIYKTKLNKLLFYTQFLCYKTYGLRLLDFEFIKEDHGPVLECLDSYLDILNKAKIIQLIETDYGLTIETSIDISKNEYSNEEYDILDKVNKKFRTYTAVDISNYSHKEFLWLNTDFKETIELNRANELNELFV